jgi:parallel beta-helix repeat protein
MSRLRVWFRCIGQAVCLNGPRALAGLMPFGEALYDIAADALRRLREAQDDDQLHLSMQEAAVASREEVKFEADAVARDVAAEQPADVRQALSIYLSLLPGAIRQSLRRPADPAGHTVPAGFLLRTPEQLVPLLPARLPRFHPGDRPSGVGNWELDELLGIGGFGEVWLARHPRLKGIAPVALKFCLDPSAASILRHEADLLDRVMRQSDHPGIVPLRQAYLDAEPLCLEYEYVPGGDLAGLLREWQQPSGGPTAEQRTKVVRQLAGIIGHAHQLDPPIVHRDLKPANVLVQARNGPARPGQGPHSSLPILRVADFGIGGIAAVHALDQARHGSARGDVLVTALRGAHTPLYASPQQARGEAPDPRDDVHALGVIWYQLLTGDLAASRPAGKGWRRKLGEQGLTADLLELLESAFDDDPAERPRDAAELAERLDDLLDSTPLTVPVRPVPPRPEPVRPRPKTPPVLVVAQDGSGDFRTIREALREAAAGARILVRPGLYREGLVLTRSVEVVGDGPVPDIIVEATEGDCVLMKTDDAVVRGLTLRGRTAERGAKFFAVDVPQGRLLLEDCDVTNDSLSAIGIHGPSANPTIRNCKIHDSQQGGVYVYDRGRGTLEGCDVYANQLAAITLSHGGDTLVRDCRLHDSKQGGGVYVHEAGKGTVERCDIYANALAGVEVKQGSTPTFRDCKVRDGKQSGIYVHENGGGLFEKCDVFANAFSGVAIRDGGDPVLRGCSVHEGKQSGVYVHENGRGTLENCQLFNNQYSGMEVKQGGDPTLRGCTIHGNREGSGVYAYDQGRGTLEDCDLFDNHFAGVATRQKGAPLVRRCKIHDHGDHDGVTIWEDGLGTFEECDIYANRYAGLRVRGGGDPTVRDCKIHDGQEGGVFFLDSARGTLEHCDVYANALAGVEIKQAANPVLRHCRIRDGKQSGVYVHESGKGIFEHCDISANAFSGLAIKEGGDPLLRNCKVRDGKQSGVYVYEDGRGTLEGCEIFGNEYAGVEIKQGGDPVVRGCNIRDGKQSGVYVHDGGRGTVERCVLTGNARGPWNIAAGCRVQRSGNRE